MPLPFAFDFKNPDYIRVFRWRVDFLAKIKTAEKARPGTIASLKLHYRENPIDFIEDWGCTFDPRNVERGLPVLLPFIPFPRQKEWMTWILQNWRDQEDGVTEKSRDMGISWCTVGLSAAMALHDDDLVVGIGSRKEEYVDVLGDPKSMLERVRLFLRYLPKEFRGGWTPAHAPHKRIMVPSTRSLITGEAGDGIGRGNRASIYFVDEAAHLERPLLVDAALSQTTNCRQDVSSVNGLGNPFAQKALGGKVRKFIFDWRDDPRKDDEWYQKQVKRFTPQIVAQEIDRNYSASVEGVLIPAAWVQAAIDAHVKLCIDVSGARSGALDVADEGRDLNAFCGRYGVLVEHLESWAGVGSDIYGTVERAFRIADTMGYREFDFDSDGLGAGVRGDARKINETRTRKVTVTPFRGSASVVNPEAPIPGSTPGDKEARRNEDFFANAKAQAWWAMRVRFQNTFRAVVEGMEYDPDEIICVSSSLPEYQQLVSELSQPTYKLNGAGKILIDKAPEGTRSPNLADSVMIAFAPKVKKSLGLFDIGVPHA